MDLYTANILMVVCSMLIMLFSLRSDISQSPRRNMLCFHLYSVIAICALCEWSGVMLDGTSPTLLPLHLAVKVVELSCAPLIGLFAGSVIHPCDRRIVMGLMWCAGVHTLLVLISVFTGLIFSVDMQNVYHHGPLYWVYMLAYGMSMAFFLAQVVSACRAYQYTGGTQLALATLLVLMGLLMQLLLPEVKIDWLAITFGTLMMSKFSSDMALQTDGLTKLVNRLGYEHLLPRLRVPATIVMFDVDHFKEVNDQHGHQAGDECLRTVAACIHGAFSAYGTCFRIGGDEFCVILTQRNAQYDVMLAHFHALMAQAREESPILPTVSVGVAHFNPTADSLDDVIARADVRMYQDKETRR